jgi:hypothetical protein
MILAQYLSGWVLENRTERLSVYDRRTDILFPQRRENREGWHESQRYMEEVGETLFASCYLLSDRWYRFAKTGISTAFPPPWITNCEISKNALDIQRN